MRSIGQAIKIAASLLVLCLALLLILPDVSNFPKWPERPSREARLAERQRQAAPPPAVPAEPALPPAPATVPPPVQQEPERQTAAEPQMQSPPPADTDRILRGAVAVTATEFEADKLRITLAGVEGLPFEETCSLGTLSAPCGAQARTALRGWLRSRSLSCDVPADAQEGSVEATCHVGNEDVARWLVMQGWARPVAGGPYQGDAEAARRDERGLWRYDATRD